MAAILDLLQPTSGFTSENSLSGVATPPYSPARAYRPGKRTRLERSDSPASVSGSIHPRETESPANKPAKKRLAVDNIKVEELTEDVGYMADVDGILPYETESADDSSDGNDDEDGDDTATDLSGDEAVSLARKLSQMDCADDVERFLEERRRRRRRERKRSGTHTKRTHSLANENVAEPTDVEALGDHDYEAGQRRLRRRTRGPDEMEYADNERPKSEPEVGQYSETGRADSPVVEVMDIDDVG